MNTYNELESVEISFKFPDSLLEFLNDFCEISTISIENFFSYLILARLEFMFYDPDELFNYINTKSNSFEKLQEGINSYYARKYILKEKNTMMSV